MILLKKITQIYRTVLPELYWILPESMSNTFFQGGGRKSFPLRAPLVTGLLTTIVKRLAAGPDQGWCNGGNCPGRCAPRGPRWHLFVLNKILFEKLSRFKRDTRIQTPYWDVAWAVA